MSTVARLTEADVVSWLGVSEVSKGRPYTQNSVSYTRVQGNQLKAMCQGNAPQPYRVEITVENGKITHGHCSCPVGSGGGCKHSAALLLVWVHSPERFSEIETLETNLQQKSKDELMRLITKMLDRYPDLETLVAMPSSEAVSLDPTIIKRQLLKALEHSSYDRDDYYHDYGYGLSEAAQHDIMELIEVSDKTLNDGDSKSAFRAYWTIAEELIDICDEYEDEEGNLSEIIGRAAEGIASAFHASSAEAEREEMLQALFDLYLWDCDYDSYGQPVSEMILEYANPEEYKKVITWLQNVMPTGMGHSADYKRQAHGGFLLELQADTLDDETFLRISRETGRSDDLIRRLLELGRLEEATAEVKQIQDYSFLRYVDLLKEAGHKDKAHEIVLERSHKDDSRGILEWLRDSFAARSEFDKALEVSETLFWQAPRLDAYQSIKKHAFSLGIWDQRQEHTLKKLKKEKLYDVLTEIYLLEADVASALKSVRQEGRRGSWGSWGVEPLAIRVAEAAEQDFPSEAIDLYRQRISQLIEARGRESYQRAAQYLQKVALLYHQLDQDDVWDHYLASVKNQKPRLPALLDELKQVGL